MIPGAGRSGDTYRDAWIEAAEKYNVLILSPMYPDDDYPFEVYHLGGLIETSNLRESVEFIENSNIAKLDETIFNYQLNPNREEWIFKDFDRIFDLVVEATASTQNQYDLFGHSAGGQILHRFVIFNPDSKANRIIAANSGFYTLPDLANQLPFGIKDVALIDENLANSFDKELILLIGELDNAEEQGGTLLRSKSADKQGFHRLERGQYFYKYSKNVAKEMDLNYNWKIKIVRAVGHNHREMAKAAAEFLYE